MMGGAKEFPVMQVAGSRIYLLAKLQGGGLHLFEGFLVRIFVLFFFLCFLFRCFFFVGMGEKAPGAEAAKSGFWLRFWI